LARAKNQTTFGKFSLPKSVKCSVALVLDFYFKNQTRPRLESEKNLWDFKTGSQVPSHCYDLLLENDELLNFNFLATILILGIEIEIKN